jgi:hypothetical protein
MIAVSGFCKKISLHRFRKIDPLVVLFRGVLPELAQPLVRNIIYVLNDESIDVRVVFRHHPAVKNRVKGDVISL